ncbi:MAG TPA: SUMF1/EgtB/PvdO family nonheme iron enzyme, partial [Polyangiaceae bacterium]|nr:SUMF1/EgtB/PvdO family nonheme iron enzyme [Polyangiaceae bacterium]
PWGNLYNPHLANHGSWSDDRTDATDGFAGLAPAGSFPDGATPTGLLDMAGNVAEWVSVDGFHEGQLVVQKGNWWQPGKHACRDAQGGHDRYYKGTETGFRCCAGAD